MTRPYDLAAPPRVAGRLTNARRAELAGQPWFLDLWERYAGRPVRVTYRPLSLETADVKFIFEDDVEFSGARISA